MKERRMVIRGKHASVGFRQVAISTNRIATSQVLNYPNLPSQLLCQILNVTSHANTDTDEIYAQASLQSVNSKCKILSYLAPFHKRKIRKITRVNWRVMDLKTKPGPGYLYWNLSDTDRVVDELEEALLVSDFGPRITVKIVESLRDDIYAGKLKSGPEIKDALKNSVLDLLNKKVAKTELKLGFSKPGVIMIVGVNGGGKTTSLGKLGYRLKSEGATILMAAGDTFWVAASDQLEIWAERTGYEIVSAEKEKAKASVIRKESWHPTPNSKPAVDPVERINTGFSKLKTKKYITNPDCTMSF
ncbi:hypothetical protein L1887_23499 [Cichorium endivia]|nr:hypothetical protein L1887_23499 [Cichorium endivia]